MPSPSWGRLAAPAPVLALLAALAAAVPGALVLPVVGLAKRAERVSEPLLVLADALALLSLLRRAAMAPGRPRLPWLLLAVAPVGQGA